MRWVLLALVVILAQGRSQCCGPTESPSFLPGIRMGRSSPRAWLLCLLPLMTACNLAGSAFGATQRPCSGPTECGVKDAESQTVSFLPVRSERNILSPRRGYVDFTIQQKLSVNNLLSGKISLKFRTFRADAILFYSHDQRRNFLQLELRGGKLAFKYNDGDKVLDSNSAYFVSDGNWHSLRIEYSWVFLDKKSSPITNLGGSLSTSKKPDSRKLRPNENVRRLSDPKLTYSPDGKLMNPVKTYVGGVAAGMADLKEFCGCLSGLKFGDHLLDFNSIVDDYPDRLAKGCNPGCSPNSCEEGGKCLERWNGNFFCNCWNNPFIGQKCQQSVSRSFSGAGGITLEFPIVRSVAIIGGKFALTVAPRPGDLLLHIDGSTSDFAIVSEKSDTIALLTRAKGNSDSTQYRVSESFTGLSPPFLVRFWLWSAAKRIQLQLNDKVAVLATWPSAPQVVSAERLHVGDATAANRRFHIPGSYQHFKGCLYNFQVFVKETDLSIELTDRFTGTSQRNSSWTEGTCPPFTMKELEEENVNSTQTDYGKLTEQDSWSITWEWYKIVLGVVCGMMFCFLVLSIIYAYHSCKKRPRMPVTIRGDYSQLSINQTNSIDCTNGSAKQTLGPSSFTSTPSQQSPRKVPYRPPYVATSLIIRDGKHMANIDSDVDLGESESELP